jgi:hypothetical protein
MQQLRPQVDAIGGVLTKLPVHPAVADARHLVWLRDQLGDLDRVRAGIRHGPHRDLRTTNGAMGYSSFFLKGR